MSKNFDRLMTHRCTLEKLDLDFAGNFVPVETHENVPCFVEWRRVLILNRNGEQVAASGIVYFRADAPIDKNHSNWRITQTHPYTRDPVNVEKLDPVDDPRKGTTHHYELAVM